MSWSQKWGKSITSGFYDSLLARNLIREEDLEPNISVFEFYIDAFYELSTCRNGEGLVPIPFTAIVEYARIYEIEDIEDFQYLIRRMDNCFINNERAKSKHKEKEGKKNAKPNANKKNLDIV